MNESHFENCVVLGAGGHATVLLETLLLAGRRLPTAMLDSDASLQGKRLMGVPVLGGDDLLPKLAEDGFESFIVGAGSSASTRLRRRLFEYGLSCGLVPAAVEHPGSHVSPSAKLGDGCQILAHCVLNTNCKLGHNVIVNTGAIVEHDCIVEHHVHLATGARLAGNVSIRSGAHIGIGAVIRQGIEIGPGAVVGAGAVVVRDVAPEVTVVGVPAHELRRVAA